MSIGDFGGNSNSNNNSNKVYEGTYYSRLRLKQSDSSKTIGVSFRSGLLIISINLAENGSFKYEPTETIYLSPTKAKLLANQIAIFKDYYLTGKIDEGKAFGVNAGMGEKVSYIAFSANKNKDIIVTIGKFDDKGQIIESDHYTLNTSNYHFAINWNDLSTNDIEKVYDSMIELDQLHELCEDFARSMNGAMGYAVNDINRFENQRSWRRIDSIMNKLGIETQYQNRSNNYGSGNSFLSGSSATSRPTTLDDFEDSL